MPSYIALARHTIDRLGYGPRPGDIERIAGSGVDRWIEEQLNPGSIPLPAELEGRLATFATLSLSPSQVFLQYGPPSLGPRMGGKLTPEQQQERNRRSQFVIFETMDARLVRAIESPRQLEESLTDFWFNHFNIFIGKDLDRLWLGNFVEAAIRPHILGRFRDLLGATAKHPAMQFFLDNWLNTAPNSPGARGQFDGINENYARELMELHTLGVNGGYTQDDVIALARILTGWTIGPVAPRRPPPPPRPAFFFPFRRAFQPPFPRPQPIPARGVFAFDPERHDFSDKLFLGRTIRGSGLAEGEEVLDMLASSPATARHISYQLAQYFFADDPADAVVEAMTKSFLSTGGNIRAVLQTLFFSEAFRSSACFGAKFKTPYRYVISAVRAAAVPVRNFRPIEGMLNQLGQRLYGCLTPDGYKNTQEAWLNPDAMIRRISFAVALAGGRLPLTTAPVEGAIGVMPARASEPPPSPPGPIVDATVLLATLGNQLSATTKASIDAAPPELRAALVLGSPDFMRC